MSDGTKRAIVGLIGGMGVILLLIGTMTAAYTTVVGLVLMLSCWFAIGVLRRYW